MVGSRKNNEEDAYRRAVLILSHRDHSVEELKKKLKRRGFSEETVRRVLRRLVHTGLLDDSKFSVSFVREKVDRRPMGRKGLVYELRRRGISEEVAGDAITAVLDEEGLNERDLAGRVLERKRGVADIGNLLRRRGFTEEVIRWALGRGNDDR